MTTNTHELIEALEMVISRLDKAKYQRELDEYDCVTMTYDRDEIDKIRQALAIQPQAEAQPGLREKIARAICKADGVKPDYRAPDGMNQPYWRNYEEHADAALSATPAVSGWRFLDAIYDAEINVQFGTFWDGGIDWTLGDHMNGVKAEGTCRTWPDVERELRAAIAVHYPAVTLPPQNEGGDGDGD